MLLAAGDPKRKVVTAHINVAKVVIPVPLFIDEQGAKPRLEQTANMGESEHKFKEAMYEQTAAMRR